MNRSSQATPYTSQTIAKDVLSSIIVFLVALPLCLGIAQASDAEPIAGLISGIVGGIVIGIISKSHTSVSGPAAGLTAIVAAQIANLKTYEAFLLAVVLAGVIQIVFGLLKAGALSAFFPSAVIKGLLAAIGVILMLKQLPLLFGHNKDMGVIFGHSEALADYMRHADLAKLEVDHSHQFGDNFIRFYKAISEIFVYGEGIQWGAICIGLLSLVFLIGWDKVKVLKSSLIPSPLIVVVLGALLAVAFSKALTGTWVLSQQQLVDVPVASSFAEFKSYIKTPDFSQWTNLSVYIGAITIAVVASLETLLNLDAVDKLDKKQRISPPNRELFAQGAGNMCAGLIGGIPVTSVVIRGTVNINSGAQTKLSGILHGFLLLGCVVLIPHLLKMIPHSCLAAILLMTGYKLASPKLFKQMWSEGRYQFLPFIVTLVAIVMTDLLVGICIGLVISILFILRSNLRRPIRRILEKHIDGDILHIELPNQVSFLNRAALESALREAPAGSRILLDLRRTDYIDPDILSLIREYGEKTAPALDVGFQIMGLKEEYRRKEGITENVDFSAQESRENLTPQQVLGILAEGNKRFSEGHPLDRDLRRKITQDERVKPFVAFLTGIDSRTPVEMIFDLELGETIVLRTPGKVIGPFVIGGMEYAATVAGVKLIVILGNTDSHVLSYALQHSAESNVPLVSGSPRYLGQLMEKISQSINPDVNREILDVPEKDQPKILYELTHEHVRLRVSELTESSTMLQSLVAKGELIIAGAIFDQDSDQVEFLQP